jgi:hypothetical protein
MKNRLGLGCRFLVVVALTFAACGGSDNSGGGADMARSGACTNANDTAIGKPAMDAAAAACGLPCYADKDAMPPTQCATCLTMKTMESTGKTLTTACNTCWTTVIICGINNCSAPCLQNGSDSSECRDCTRKAGCDSAFSTCSGF